MIMLLCCYYIMLFLLLHHYGVGGCFLLVFFLIFISANKVIGFFISQTDLQWKDLKPLRPKEVALIASKLGDKFGKEVRYE